MSPTDHDAPPDELTDEDVARIEADFDAAEAPEERYDLALALGDIWMGSEPEAAVEWYEKALDELPGDAEALAGRAEALFELWRFDEAATDVDLALGTEPKAGRPHFVKAMLSERRGKDEEARQHYKAAAKDQPDRFFQPFRLSRADFEKVVKEALATLPDDVRKLVEGVTVAVDDLPDDDRREDMQRDGMAPTILGLFEGTPPLEVPTGAPPELPPHITLFQRNLERTAKDRATLREEIVHTVLHEVGHLVGMDEDDLDDAGYS